MLQEKQSVYIKINQAASDHQNTQATGAHIPADNAYHVSPGSRAVPVTVELVAGWFPLRSLA